jgi:two-component system sensor histidine kinase RegB
MFGTLSQTTLNKNLQRLFFLRCITIAIQSLTFASTYWIFNIPLPWTEIITTLLLLSILNFVTWVRLRRSFSVSNIEFFLQILIDVFALSALLYFNGGSTNPFVSLYLLPLTITAAVLPWVYTWLMAATTIGLYSLLLFHHVPLPHDHNEHVSEFDLHVSGMWLAFVLSTTLISWFVVKMSGSIRERDKELSEIREQALRDEQLIALGTMAAGAAHELGTPLATMAIVSKEIQNDHIDNQDLQKNMGILRDQITQCKHTLTELLADAGQSRTEDASGQAVDLFLQDILEKWRLMRPTVKFTYVCNGDFPAPSIINMQPLSQSILNLLNNAADASVETSIINSSTGISVENIIINSNWNKKELHLEILDFGKGLSEEALKRAGQAFFTSKDEHGFGIGLFLANANIERYGGSVHLTNYEKGGACTQVILPLIGTKT